MPEKKPPPHRGILDIVQNANGGIEATIKLIIREDFRHKREAMLQRVLSYMCIEEVAIEKLCRGCEKKVEEP